MNKFNTLTKEQQVVVKKEIQKMLSESIVSFSFLKKDGTLRLSKGCLDAQVIEQNNGTPKTTTSDSKKETPVNLVKYFDIEKKAWRSFNIETLSEFMEIPADIFIDKII